MRKARIIKKSKKRYFIDDVNYERFHAVRYDARFGQWKKHHEGTELGTIVDRFIEDMKQK